MKNHYREYKRVNILGCPFDRISFAETEQFIKSAIINNRSVQLVPGSIDSVIKAKHDKDFNKILWDSDLVFADGVPIVWAASLIKNPIKERVSGTDIVYSCAKISEEFNCNIGLIGGRFNITRRASTELKKIFRGSNIHAIETPFPLDDKANEKMLDKIKDVDAKIVLVALGAPKQEKWIKKFLKKTGANVGIGIGSAFDIIGKDKPRAPKILRDHGFEWLWRLIQEPKRLGRRYIIEDAPFLADLASEMIKRRIIS